MNFHGVQLASTSTRELSSLVTMDQTNRILQLVGTFLPIYGIVLTVIAGLTLQGRWRVFALLVLPLVTYGLCSLFGASLAYDGNMLYVLLVSVYIIALCIYYPVLAIIGTLSVLRQRRKAANPSANL